MAFWAPQALGFGPWARIQRTLRIQVLRILNVHEDFEEL